MKIAINAYTLNTNTLGTRVIYMYSTLNTQTGEIKNNLRDHFLNIDDELQEHIDIITNYIGGEITKDDSDENLMYSVDSCTVAFQSLGVRMIYTYSYLNKDTQAVSSNNRESFINKNEEIQESIEYVKKYIIQREKNK
jgi:hypothetical protein